MRSSNKQSFWLPSAFPVWLVLNKWEGIFGSVKFVTEGWVDYGLCEWTLRKCDLQRRFCHRWEYHPWYIKSTCRNFNFYPWREDAIMQYVGYCNDHSTCMIIDHCGNQNLVIPGWGVYYTGCFLTVPPNIHITKMKNELQPTSGTLSRIFQHSQVPERACWFWFSIWVEQQKTPFISVAFKNHNLAIFSLYAKQIFFSPFNLCTMHIAQAPLMSGGRSVISTEGKISFSFAHRHHI